MSRLIPSQVSTSLDLQGWKLKIKNKTEYDWTDTTVMLQDCYAQDICVWSGTIAKNQTLELAVQNGLHFYHFENGVRLRIFTRQHLAYERIFNHKRKRSFVFYSNSSFEEITKKAIEGLRNYTELPVVYYTVGFDSNIDLPDVECRRHDVTYQSSLVEDPQYMQMIKPQMLLRALDDGIEDGLFIDSDVQVRHNIEAVFDRFSHVDFSTPVLNRNYWQFLFVGTTYIPQDELSMKMGYREERQFQGHGITNIFLFRKEMRELFNEWRYWCEEPEIVNSLRKRVYLHDEVIFNVLCWKNRIKQVHANLLFNVNDLKDVKAFFHLKTDDGQTHLDFNQFNCGHLSQSFAPYDRDDIVGFHCVKDPSVAESINTYLKGRVVRI